MPPQMRPDEDINVEIIDKFHKASSLNRLTIVWPNSRQIPLSPDWKGFRKLIIFMKYQDEKTFRLPAGFFVHRKFLRRLRIPALLHGQTCQFWIFTW
jgi:hypothetical protein